jgi:hypothetical protein
MMRGIFASFAAVLAIFAVKCSFAIDLQALPALTGATSPDAQ